MYEDVRLAVKGRVPIEFYGRMGGVVPFPEEVLDEIQRVATQPLEGNGDARQRWLERMEDIVAE
jgi:2-oxoglutarate ferredoxin oxidoreductase subunit alpha